MAHSPSYVTPICVMASSVNVEGNLFNIIVLATICEDDNQPNICNSTLRTRVQRLTHSSEEYLATVRTTRSGVVSEGITHSSGRYGSAMILLFQFGSGACRWEQRIGLSPLGYLLRHAHRRRVTTFAGASLYAVAVDVTRADQLSENTCCVMHPRVYFFDRPCSQGRNHFQIREH
jgi:hypothetical protein